MPCVPVICSAAHSLIVFRLNFITTVLHLLPRIFFFFNYVLRPKTKTVKSRTKRNNSFNAHATIVTGMHCLRAGREYGNFRRPIRLTTMSKLPSNDGNVMSIVAEGRSSVTAGSTPKEIFTVRNSNNDVLNNFRDLTFFSVFEKN